MSLKRPAPSKLEPSAGENAPSVPAGTVENCLTVFCESLLLLLQSRRDENRSLLADVIPGFLPAFKECCQQTSTLRAELKQWEERSHQLIQLAALYGGNGSSDLVASLEHARLQATHVISSLDDLRRATDTETDLSAANLHASSKSSPAKSSYEAVDLHLPENHLRGFCDAVIELTKAGPEGKSVLSQTLPSLVRMFRACDPTTFDSLRDELHASETRSDKLLQLATQYCGTVASELQQNVKRSQARVNRVIDSFEALHVASDLMSAPPALAVIPQPMRIGPGTNRDGAASQAVTDQTRARGQSFFQMAGRSYQRRDYEMADRLYSEALRFDSTLRLAYVHRGRIRLAGRKFEHAITDFSSALQIDPNDCSTLRWRGDALALCERFAEAIADYDRALLLFPNRYLVRYNRAVVLRQAGDLDQAKSEFEQLVKLRPQQAPLYLNQGLICLSQGECEAAVEFFLTALRYQPNCQEAIDRLAELGIAPSQPKVAEKQIAPVVPKRISEPNTSGIDDRTTNTQELELSVTTPVHSEEDSEDELAMSFLDTALPLSDKDESEESSRRPTAALPDLSIESREPVKKPVPVESAPSRREGVAPFLDISVGAPSLSQDRSLSLTGKFEARCPCCDAISFIALDKLQMGKVLTCPHCDRFFTSEPSGRMVEVKKTRGKWKVVQRRSTADWPWSPTQIAGVVGVAVLLLSLFFFIPPRAAELAANDQVLPKDLEPRAKMFTVAWLKGDIRTMRRLTGDSRGSDLFMWCMENPTPLTSVPPTLERDLQMKVEITKSVPPTTQLKIRLDGLQPTRGSGSSELVLAWEQEDETWVFQPFVTLEM